MLVYNDDANLQVSDTCVRNTLLNWDEWVELIPWDLPSTNPENLPKIGPVDFEIIAPTGIVKI